MSRKFCGRDGGEECERGRRWPEVGTRSDERGGRQSRVGGRGGGGARARRERDRRRKGAQMRPRGPCWQSRLAPAQVHGERPPPRPDGRDAQPRRGRQPIRRARRERETKAKACAAPGRRAPWRRANNPLMTRAPVHDGAATHRAGRRLLGAEVDLLSLELDCGGVEGGRGALVSAGRVGGRSERAEESRAGRAGRAARPRRPRRPTHPGGRLDADGGGEAAARALEAALGGRKGSRATEAKRTVCEPRRDERGRAARRRGVVELGGGHLRLYD